MRNLIDKLRSQRIGLALSGGAVRGLAHIGTIKVLAEAGIQPAIIAGTSVGSLIGASIAAGMNWQELADMARAIFWPTLLHGERLEKFCANYLPENFAQLKLPFAAVATALPSMRVVTIREGKLASAISASCALRIIRRPVRREGELLKDGGFSCVLPAQACREMGADFIISSDVWELSSILRVMQCDPDSNFSGRFYPQHYRTALKHTDLHIHHSIPLAGYVPGPAAVDRMIARGALATEQMLSQLKKKIA